MAKKKNGKPKFDLPTIDKESLLINLGETDVFSLDSKNEQKIWDIDGVQWKKYCEKENEENNEYELNSEED